MIRLTFSCRDQTFHYKKDMPVFFLPQIVQVAMGRPLGQVHIFRRPHVICPTQVVEFAEINL